MFLRCAEIIFYKNLVWIQVIFIRSRKIICVYKARYRVELDIKGPNLIGKHIYIYLFSKNKRLRKNQNPS